jgi:hypothetical protein
MAVSPGRVVRFLAPASVVLLVASACGDDKKSAALFNVSAARQGVEAELRRAYPTLTIESVRCAKRVVARPGRTFPCSAVVAGAQVDVQVEIGTRREYTIRTSGVVVTKAVAEQAASARATLPVTLADCGPGPAYVLAPGASVPCTVTLSDGSKHSVVVRAADATGRLLVEAA